MAMKKKIAAGMGAVVITAMCFGSTAFAESIPVNGSGAGDSNTANGTTEVGVEYKKADSTTANWTVNIPQKVSFKNVTLTSTDLKQPLNYSAVIADPSTGDKVEYLKISLPSEGNTFIMEDPIEGYKTAAGAFKILNTVGNDVTAGAATDTAALIVPKLENGASAEATIQADVSKFTALDKTITDGTHAFGGSFTVLITPVKATE